ncbi:oxidoreductase [Colletotrichum higginsianum]|uniref:Oxidoreductase n=2 Tax=Colletotrichum higginsianum TaxID=80884 RepID=H1VVA0_COLHI|nr:Oxidoreductase [Colletotrichum higginsianum IMI 349063]OBR14746.1 Oxidoreductase [Colletotrichum higginsianum IMI 349063]TID01739.1 Inositol 2-dehydrogenase 3 [Colletotrichum higginsianum]CCF44159.1 oxidoreductase [Colletotrichum higginsianum]
MASQQQTRVLRVGIIGCGEITQVNHISNLNFLYERYQTTYLCDISQQALAHCARKVQGGTPKTTSDAAELCSSPDVDVVLIANADAYHVDHGILALQNDKYVLIEKPVSVCFRDLDLLIEAEKKSKGKVMVGTMRRFATAFTDAVEEVGGMDKIQYARVRDIIGPNSTFVDQSGTFPLKFSDYSEADTNDRVKREEDIFEQALGKEFGVPVTSNSQTMLRILGGLGTHDLSAMREIVGMPKSVAGACLTFPGIFSVLFKYDGFPVTYESGFSNVPQFDAHIEVYSPNKIVRVNFDTPYVKGLPVTMTVRELVGKDGFQERTVRKTYQDPYTNEFLEFYDCVVNGKAPKTSAADARNDVELFKMILRADAGRYQST